MVNPQKENGYTAIANEIVEALTRIRISGEAMQILFAIIRKTYGYNKLEDAISLSQFSLATGLKKTTVIKGLNKLKLLNLITQKDNAIANIYRFNKHFDTWKPLPKKVTLSKKVITITQKGNKYDPKRDIQKTVTKDNTTKDIATPSVAGTKINELINLFKPVNPSSYKLYKNKNQRLALETLVKKFGLEKVQAIINALPEIINKPYAPIITTPVQLEDNLGKLIAFVKKEKINQPQEKHLIL